MARYSSWREKPNAFIHSCYIRHEWDECLAIIEEQLRECAFCEYPLYVKALILRQRGKIQESLILFQSAACLNPNNTANLKQVGHSYYLLGRHKQAIQVYEEAQKIGEENVRKRNEAGRQSGAARLSADDWEIWHNKGLCYIHMKQLGLAIESFKRANAIQRHDSTYIQLGKVHQLQENFEEALKVYQDALDFSPENPELLTTMGLVWLRLQDNPKAFVQLGNSLTHDPRNAKTILAAGSIIQDNQEMDTALIKYRVAAVQTPNSAQLWNNIGMCFFGKAFHTAAVSCLKRALYLDPFEWIICYNLGLVHLNTGQYASAFHYFSASINLKPDFPASYMYLAITLARLKDFPNSCTAYEKAISMEQDHMNHLNYAITLYNHGETEKARTHYGLFKELYTELNQEEMEHDFEVMAQSQALQEALEKADKAS